MAQILTPDVRFIVFSSHANDLTSHPDGNGLGTDIYVRDVVTNITKLVSVNLAGTKQVIVRLPDGVAGDLWVTVSLRGLTTNGALVKLRP